MLYYLFRVWYCTVIITNQILIIVQGLNIEPPTIGQARNLLQIVYTV